MLDKAGNLAGMKLISLRMEALNSWNNCFLYAACIALYWSGSVGEI